MQLSKEKTLKRRWWLLWLMVDSLASIEDDICISISITSTLPMNSKAYESLTGSLVNRVAKPDKTFFVFRVSGRGRSAI